MTSEGAAEQCGAGERVGRRRRQRGCSTWRPSASPSSGPSALPFAPPTSIPPPAPHRRRHRHRRCHRRQCGGKRRGARPVGKDNRNHALADTVGRTRSLAGGVHGCSRGARRQHAIRHGTDKEAELLLVEPYISDSRSRQMKPGRRVAGAGPTGGPRVTRVKSRLERGCRNDGITMTTQLLRLCLRAERRQPIRG